MKIVFVKIRNEQIFGGLESDHIGNKNGNTNWKIDKNIEIGLGEVEGENICRFYVGVFIKCEVAQ